MHFSTLVLASAIAAVANAQATEFPFKPDGECITNCLVTVGKKFYPDFTTDPTSPHFIASLAISYDRTSPHYMQFMAETGPCKGTCPADEINKYVEEHKAKQAWYEANKNSGGNTGTPSPSATKPATDSATNSATEPATATATTATTAVVIATTVSNAPISSSITRTSSPASPSATNPDSGASISAAVSGLIGVAALLSAVVLF
ncbi:hypothetical protein BX616_005475 [Lobosporangium transversale]|uniref:Uncharacterized protein n=1 Tax=Lobosporangium transversale TaxID=64571 RepID=A0A1Y2G6P8_9FUNG|nr:hypothetical protein BCR41DRAFT_364255 [Lobosporangium transversale]KAF9915749.1 hypothetical protein BX616_005475 [Lobosporangium transversale]ORY98386.1 hypothetical protein BCR41DRAFT_364255 [Lobosporangium transversale]|eukprot:XP_021875778.1 hypothetical protein BCR41DRAFT_364255 [Lobosporangium transversale]